MNAVIKHYEALHRIPELAFQEYCTAAYLEKALRDAGYAPVRVGETGLYADLCVDPKLPWLLFRADMDALAVTEETGLPFASETDGMMHACGHDAHAAMLLTAAIQLKKLSPTQNIRFVFQPAEEITSGAHMMIDAGVIPENTVAAFAMHVYPQLQTGMIVAKAGALLASSTQIQIHCTGKNAHCNKRHEGKDALLTAAKIATRFHEAEAMAQGDGTVLFCGTLYSGTGYNIVADASDMAGTLRSFCDHSRERVLNKLDEIVQECAAEHGTQAKLSAFAYNPPVINPAKLADQAQKLLPESISDFEPILGAEDFACYQQQVPGMYFWLGVGDTAPLHNGKFIVPKDVLPIGVDTWLKLADHKW